MYVGLILMAVSIAGIVWIYKFLEEPEIVIEKDEYEKAVELQQRRKSMRSIDG